MAILEVQGLSKDYGPLTALNGFSLTIQAGQTFGLLGPNGSGKTTFLGLILDVLKPTSGTYRWFGQLGENRYRRRIGALLETPNFYPYLNATENLQILADIKGVAKPDLERLLEMVQLGDRRRLPFHAYSLGMKGRLAIASCLVGDPDVVIVDEPTNGLDPQGIIEVRQLLQRITGLGKTVILASHLLDEVEKICSHVAIIKNGRCLATGAIGAILRDEPQVEVGCSIQDEEALQRLLAIRPEIRNIQRSGKWLVLEVLPGTGAQEINRWAAAQGIVLNHLVLKSRSLELEFLEITR